VLQGLGDLSTRPGLTTVFEVVVAGFSLTAALYHLLRLRAARRMRAEPIPVGVVRTHLELSRSLSQGSFAASPEPRIAAAG
jgi:hypothetical protein